MKAENDETSARACGMRRSGGRLILDYEIANCNAIKEHVGPGCGTDALPLRCGSRPA